MSPWAVRRSYASAGWHLWRHRGYTFNGQQVTWYYASRRDGSRFIAGSGMTLCTISPLATLEAVLAHPSMRKR